MLIVRDPEEYNNLMACYNSCLIEELLRALRNYPDKPKYLKLDPGIYFNVDTRELCIETKEYWAHKFRRDDVAKIEE
jgi:hypothetical protein